MGSAGEKKTRKQRRYSPTVERLEEVRLLSSAAQAHPIASVAAEHDLLGDLPGAVSHLPEGSQPFSGATWDAALVQTELSDILGSSSARDVDGKQRHHDDFAHGLGAAPADG